MTGIFCREDIMTNPSPLRYPGGKFRFYSVIKDILCLNRIQAATYIEPFAGGAGLALQLLLSGDVARIIINDFDPHIYAFWHSVLTDSEALCDLIECTPVDLEHWNRQKEVYADCNQSNLLKLGFSTFFLNRTNVSGVLTGGVIGGKNQAGKYKIDARYDKKSLIGKIRRIAELQDNILLFNTDARDLFSLASVRHTRNTFVNFDPPYVSKGDRLYKNSFRLADHVALAKFILGCKRKWIVTYDKAPIIREAYSSCRLGYLDVSYSIHEKKNAQEYIIFSNSLKIPDSIARVNVEE